MTSLGVGLFGTEPVPQMGELVRLAEDLGFANAWIGDSQNIWRDTYVILAAAALQTRRIGIGTGVTNPVTRHVSVTASAWASVAELAPGRTAFVIGTGDSSLRTMGGKPCSVGELEARVGELRALLHGAQIASVDGGAPYRLLYPPSERIPIYVAAASPRSLRAAGRVGDGVLACVGVDAALVSAALEHVAHGAREASRDIADIRVLLWTAVAIDDDGIAARDLVRSFTASVVIPRVVGVLEDQEMDAVRRIRQRYAYVAHMRTDAEHRALVPDSLVRRYAIAGTAEECRAQLDAVLEYPVDQIAVVPFAAAGAHRGPVMRRLCEAVAPSSVKHQDPL